MKINLSVIHWSNFEQIPNHFLVGAYLILKEFT